MFNVAAAFGFVKSTSCPVCLLDRGPTHCLMYSTTDQATEQVTRIAIVKHAGRGDERVSEDDEAASPQGGSLGGLGEGARSKEREHVHGDSAKLHKGGDACRVLGPEVVILFECGVEGGVRLSFGLS